MLNIVCIGSGRLAHQLMPALQSADARIMQVYSRSLDHAQALADKVNADEVTDQLSDIKGTADIYFFAVADDAIPGVSKNLIHLENGHAIFVHCSGVLNIDALPFKRAAVFYPLQSFSNEHPVDWKTTPLLITGSLPVIDQELFMLARRISNAVYHIKDTDKAILHLSAVWANNFTNHMLAIAEKLCIDHNIDFEILKPLIKETFEKALSVGPSLSQTGPAIRGDEHTIEKHIQMLKDEDMLASLYSLISENIRSQKTDGGEKDSKNVRQ
jgi:predicted short-subunit dehydrogenase-like oxidoreductase (DUF2520 family)